MAMSPDTHISQAGVEHFAHLPSSGDIFRFLHLPNLRPVRMGLRESFHKQLPAQTRPEPDDFKEVIKAVDLAQFAGNGGFDILPEVNFTPKVKAA